MDQTKLNTYVTRGFIEPGRSVDQVALHPVVRAAFGGSRSGLWVLYICGDEQLVSQLFGDSLRYHGFDLYYYTNVILFEDMVLYP